MWFNVRRLRQSSPSFCAALRWSSDCAFVREKDGRRAIIVFFTFTLHPFSFLRWMFARFRVFDGRWSGGSFKVRHCCALAARFFPGVIRRLRVFPLWDPERPGYAICVRGKKPHARQRSFCLCGKQVAQIVFWLCLNEFVQKVLFVVSVCSLSDTPLRQMLKNGAQEPQRYLTRRWIFRSNGRCERKDSDQRFRIRLLCLVAHFLVFLDWIVWIGRVK